MRQTVNARLKLHQARSVAATHALELRPLVEEVTEDIHGVRATVGELTSAIGRIETALAETRDLLAVLQESLLRHERLGRVHYDDLGRLRAGLTALRRADAYGTVFELERPLVSVPIATYNAGELLVERAIVSVQAQTYTEWEIVVVGDGCTDDTADRIEALADPRIRFFNLPFRTLDAGGSRERWLVSGSAPQNLAVELSRGEWLAPLDDDDEFLPDHLAVLLELARARHAELAYGKIVRPDGQEHFAAPPESEQIGMQAVLYLRSLATVFEWDTRSWVLDEPADWNLIRRMREAGVLMAATDVPVTRYYPSFGARV